MGHDKQQLIESMNEKRAAAGEDALGPAQLDAPLQDPQAIVQAAIAASADVSNMKNQIKQLELGHAKVTNEQTVQKAQANTTASIIHSMIGDLYRNRVRLVHKGWTQAKDFKIKMAEFMKVLMKEPNYIKNTIQGHQIDIEMKDMLDAKAAIAKLKEKIHQCRLTSCLMVLPPTNPETNLSRMVPKVCWGALVACIEYFGDDMGLDKWQKPETLGPMMLEKGRWIETSGITDKEGILLIRADYDRDRACVKILVKNEIKYNDASFSGNDLVHEIRTRWHLPPVLEIGVQASIPDMPRDQAAKGKGKGSGKAFGKQAKNS